MSSSYCSGARKSCNIQLIVANRNWINESQYGTCNFVSRFFRQTGNSSKVPMAFTTIPMSAKMSLFVRKTNNLDSEPGPIQPSCTVTEDG